ncbi:MFS general substrate transporter [Wallemia mellicola]|uniref:MFS general substrate transporter n=1 Tax=Wallemia mellicola TaxID=1708541 RepID=A0A4V4MKP4_9BASI|nr:MFS general substrate transporter [Wallemia mellicola]
MSSTKDDGKQKKAVRGQWRENEKAHEIPDNNMWIVFPCIMGAVFLSAMDQTIVSTALATISDELHASEAEYSWVGVAYMLTSTAMIPVVSKLGNIVGEKIIFLVGIVVFLLGSGLCGGAKSMIWLCTARGVQGLGGGTIMASVQIIISLITPLQSRGKFSGLIGSVWGVASLIGPLVGGAFTEHVNWNWCFFINLPIGGVVLIALIVFLKLNPKERPPYKEVLKQFDYIGLLSILTAAICIIVGFSVASSSTWKNPAVIALIVVGGVVLLFAGVWETYTTKSQIIPPRLFKTLTTSSILFGTFFHAFGFFNGSYYLPLYFQVANESSPTLAGVELLPFSLGSSITSVLSGFLVARYKRYRPIIWCSWAVQIVGYALITTLERDSNRAKQVLYLLVTAFGVGGLFQTPLLALQAAVPLADMGLSTGAYVFVRSMAGTVAISVGGTIMSNLTKKKLANIPDAGAMASSSTEDLTGIKDIEPVELKLEIQQAYSEAIATIFIVVVALIGVGLITSLFIKRYSMEVKNVKQGETQEEDKEKQDDKEKQTDIEGSSQITAAAATESYEKQEKEKGTS